MTVIEQRFLNAAIDFFNRKQKEEKSQFIEVTIPNGEKQLVNKNHIIKVVPYDHNKAKTLIVTPVGHDSIEVIEPYDKIKSML